MLNMKILLELVVIEVLMCDLHNYFLWKYLYAIIDWALYALFFSYQHNTDYLVRNLNIEEDALISS